MALCTIECGLFVGLFIVLIVGMGMSADAPEHNIYQKQGKGVVYLRPIKKQIFLYLT